METAATTRKRIPTIIVLILLLAVAVAGAVYALSGNTMIATFWSLVPPLIAIIMALVTKEVYSSLLIGIILGNFFFGFADGKFSFETFFNGIFFSDGGIITNLADSWNVGIMVFLVVLGIMVALMNKAGGASAFGRWAGKHIKTRVGAELATVVLGVLIFVDDYFNCLTVGSVMRPITDSHKVSRAKLAYLIDATAAPVCIIAPISSWAAAVTSYVPEESGINGFLMFLRTIPYNLYAILTIIMLIVLAIAKFDYGPMAKHELNAIQNGDLFTTEGRPYGDDTVADEPKKGASLWDMVLPVIVLIVFCIIGLIYTGGFFEGNTFASSFADADASMGLVLGSAAALVFTFIYYMIRRCVDFKTFMGCFPEGFIAMVPAMLILALAWSLGSTTKYNLGSTDYVQAILANADTLKSFLPLILFLIACGISFSTGTSWGTFGIMIPIVCGIYDAGSPVLTIAIAAAMGGAVMGDHCSPISDTTIMASAGAHSDHVNHVSTQLPYAVTVALCCALGYLIAAFTTSLAIILPAAIILELILLFGIKAVAGKKTGA
ncbi:MAG: Na+/H+ antiporter NhaC family protein [Oscillospiraceae bacterium]|nr:Na+/H+ antiporter NhaC family protein [Oscillospiraceae bacterium]